MKENESEIFKCMHDLSYSTIASKRDQWRNVYSGAIQCLRVFLCVTETSVCPGGEFEPHAFQCNSSGHESRACIIRLTIAPILFQGLLPSSDAGRAVSVAAEPGERSGTVSGASPYTLPVTAALAARSRENDTDTPVLVDRPGTFSTKTPHCRLLVLVPSSQPLLSSPIPEGCSGLMDTRINPI